MAALEEQALRLRGEVAAAEMERKVLERRLALVRRERVPNLTLSAFAERGEINDRILGVGLSVPLPLPAPIGRTRAGEIAGDPGADPRRGELCGAGPAARPPRGGAGAGGASGAAWGRRSLRGRPPGPSARRPVVAAGGHLVTAALAA